MNPTVKAAIAGIPETAWTPIRYPRAIWDDQLRCWVSDAEVAEVEYTAFTSKKGQAITARLIVRRVKDLNRKAAQGQDELFPAWRYHAVFTDSPFATLQAEEHHRDHAQVEQVFADLADGPLAHLPSGSFPANAAWLACAAIGHNLLRAAGSLASLACAKARAATLRRDLIGVAARIARHGRGEITMHLPEGWHRETEWMNLFEAACGPPAPCGLTSPEPVTALPRPKPKRPPAQDPRQGPVDQPQKGKRQETRARPALKVRSSGPAQLKRSPEFTRWIEAKGGS